MNPLDFDFPVWTIGTVGDDGQGVAILRISDPNFASAVPIFTDIDLAERFKAKTIEDRPGNHRLFPIKDYSTLATFTKGLQSVGAQYVVIDFFFGQQHASATFLRVEDVIRESENRGVE